MIDVTFHCISEHDLQYYVFDIYNGCGATIDEISAQLACDPSEADLLSRIYHSWRKLENGDFVEEVGFMVAAISGFLHPYWYCRGACLSDLSLAGGLSDLFTPLTDLAGGQFAERPTTNRRLLSQPSGSGIVTNASLVAHQDVLLTLATGSPAWNEESLESLDSAVDYAVRRGFGILEAVDLVVPIENRCYSRYSNLRAHFLGNN